MITNGIQKNGASARIDNQLKHETAYNQMKKLSVSNGIVNGTMKY